MENLKSVNSSIHYLWLHSPMLLDWLRLPHDCQKTCKSTCWICRYNLEKDQMFEIERVWSNGFSVLELPYYNSDPKINCLLHS